MLGWARGLGLGGGTPSFPQSHPPTLSDFLPVSPSRQLETLTGHGRHCGTGEGMQGSKRHLEASPRSGGPGEGLQGSPKDW